MHAIVAAAQQGLVSFNVALLNTHTHTQTNTHAEGEREKERELEENRDLGTKINITAITLSVQLDKQLFLGGTGCRSAACFM